MTNPSDKALAQAFRELQAAYAESIPMPGTADHGGQSALQAIHNRARELDATPPAQAAEAVERVARAIHAVQRESGTANDWGWSEVGSGYQGEYRRMARAAIAAMRAGEG